MSKVTNEQQKKTPLFTKNFLEFSTKYHKNQPNVTIEYDQGAKDAPPMIHMHTERLHLYSATSKDLKNYDDFLFGDQEVMKTYGSGVTFETDRIKKFLEDYEARLTEGNLFSGFAIELNENSEFVGHIITGGSEEQNSSVITYITRESMWNKGYSKEAAGAIVFDYTPYLIEKGFKVNVKDSDPEPLKRMIATALKDGNPASNKLLLRLGFESYGEPTEKFGGIRNHYELKIVEEYTEALPDNVELQAAGAVVDALPELV